MQDFILAKQAEIAELCRTHHVRRLYIFGSAVRSDFDPETSDVDIRVEFDKGNYIPAHFALLDALTAILGRRVDLMSVETIPNPYLRKIIEDQQVLLYAA